MRSRKVDDPLLRACPTCGALTGQGCREVLGDESLTSFATRLVHKRRLEEGATHA
jgi:hypothetical protein